MNTSFGNLNVRLLRDANSDHISLRVRPGTDEADVVEKAALAGMYQAEGDGYPLTNQQKIEVRAATWALKRAGLESLKERLRDPEPVVFADDVAATVLDGLVALPLAAAEKRAELTGLHSNEAAIREPEVAEMEATAATAERIQEQLLDQSIAIGGTALQGARTATLQGILSQS